MVCGLCDLSLRVSVDYYSRSAAYDAAYISIASVLQTLEK